MITAVGVAVVASFGDSLLVSGGILEVQGANDVHEMLLTPREVDDFLFPVEASLIHREVWSASQFRMFVWALSFCF